MNAKLNGTQDRSGYEHKLRRYSRQIRSRQILRVVEKTETKEREQDKIKKIYTQNTLKGRMVQRKEREEMKNNPKR